MFRNWRYINGEISDRNALVDCFGPLFRRFLGALIFGRGDELRSWIMPMLNADERSPLDAAIKGLGELSVERYFAGSAPAVSIPPKREGELPLVPGSARNDARFGPGQRERRRELRISTDAPAFVTVLNSFGHEECPARIVDVSERHEDPDRGISSSRRARTHSFRRALHRRQCEALHRKRTGVLAGVEICSIM